MSVCTVTCFLAKRKLHRGFSNACNLMEATLRLFYAVHNHMAGRRMSVISCKAAVYRRKLYGLLYVFKNEGHICNRSEGIARDNRLQVKLHTYIYIEE